MADKEVILFQIKELSNKQKVVLFQELIQMYPGHWKFAELGEKERMIWAQSFGDLARSYFSEQT